MTRKKNKLKHNAARATMLAGTIALAWWIIQRALREQDKVSLPLVFLSLLLTPAGISLLGLGDWLRDRTRFTADQLAFAGTTSLLGGFITQEAAIFQEDRGLEKDDTLQWVRCLYFAWCTWAGLLFFGYENQDENLPLVNDPSEELVSLYGSFAAYPDDEEKKLLEGDHARLFHMSPIRERARQEKDFEGKLRIPASEITHP